MSGHPGPFGAPLATPKSQTTYSVQQLEDMAVGSVVYVGSLLTWAVPYKRTRSGWRTFNPRTFRANGKSLTSAQIAERGAR